MCGIAGAIWTDPAKALEPATLQRMIAVLRHRGPDDEGTAMLVPARDALSRAWPWDIAGWRSSTWPADSSRWPTKTSTVWVVFNGEIYNFRALRRGWKARGHRFRTAQRHGNPRPPLRRRRPGDARHAQRHVRLGPLGRPAAAAAAGPRSAGQEAAGLSPRARPAAVCQRIEEPVAGARRAAARSTRRPSTNI